MTSHPFEGPPEAQPARIGRYTLLARLGEGGMSVVHLAQGPSGEHVALKVLRPHVVGDDEGRSRLAREVTSLRRVRSPHVAEVYDADPWGARPYVVTRYVDGPSLYERVREAGPVTGAALHAIAAGLVEAVIAVHRAEVLHRDIKPSNVLLAGGRDPVLIDFGLAKLAEDSRLTATGWLMGTPGYLAPEVLYGDEATPAADVHAWAATVAFAATGQTPFGRGPAMAVMDRARRGEHDLSAVPPWLRPLLERCLAPDPAQRPGAPEVQARLGPPAAYAVGAPAVQTRPITVAQPAPQPPYPPRPPAQQPPRQHVPPPVTTPRPALRLLLVTGLLALFSAAVALAPYVTAVAILLLAWLLRSGARGHAAMSDRRAMKGRRRSDALVRVVAAPWHLAVTLPGTVVLWAATFGTAALVAVPLWAAGIPGPRALLTGGVLGALVLWWGPGSRLFRRPVRWSVWQSARSRSAAWVCAGGLFATALVLLAALGSTGVVWWPQAGPPFDPRDLVPPGFR